MRLVVHIAVVLALVTALISPACQFISGKGFIEICGADGMLQKIVAPLGFESPDAPTDKTDHAATEKCPFCLTHANMKSIAAGHADIVLFFLIAFAVVFAFAQRLERRQELSPLFPRAPPAIV